MCNNAPYLTFVSTKQQSGYTYQPDCNKWSCAECRPTLEAAWNVHASLLFEVCPDGIGYLCVSEQKLPAFTKQLRRDGTNYIRVRGHGIFHFYLGSPEKAKYRLPREAAIAFFAEHVSLAPAGEGHVVSCSKAWRKSKRVGPQKSQPAASDAICVATGVTTDSVKAILAALQIEPTISAGIVNFDFARPQILAEFLVAIKAAPRQRPQSSIRNLKKTSKFTDSRAERRSEPAKVKPNPAFDRLRAGCQQVV